MVASKLVVETVWLWVNLPQFSDTCWQAFGKDLGVKSGSSCLVTCEIKEKRGWDPGISVALACSDWKQILVPEVRPQQWKRWILAARPVASDKALAPQLCRSEFPHGDRRQWNKWSVYWEKKGTCGETHRWAHVWGFLPAFLRPGEPALYLFRPLRPRSQRCVPQFAVALTSSGSCLLLGPHWAVEAWLR